MLNKALDYLTKYTYYKVLTTIWISPIVDNGVHYSLVIEEKKKKWYKQLFSTWYYCQSRQQSRLPKTSTIHKSHPSSQFQCADLTGKKEYYLELECFSYYNYYYRREQKKRIKPRELPAIIKQKSLILIQNKITTKTFIII